MDDMTAFERQVARDAVRDVGPIRPVDDLAIFNAITTTTQSPKWRFQPMFSATKFVVAGVIVALFGGFLLSGVIPQQPSEEQLPGVGASASATAEPEQSSEVDAAEQADTLVRRDLLPGVDLEVQEVRPGVYRVLSDGENNGLQSGVWDVAVTPEQEVWVEKHRLAGYSLSGEDPGQPAIRNARVLRLGDPEEYFLGTDRRELSLDVVGGKPRVKGLNLEWDWDGDRWRQVNDDCLRPPDGNDPDAVRWVPDPRPQWCDGMPQEWSELLPSEWPVVVRVDADGQIQTFSRDGLGLTDGTWLGPGLGGDFYASSGDGTTWMAMYDSDSSISGLARYDGERWEFIESDLLQVDGPGTQRLDVAPDGTVWVVWETGRGLSGASWDGESWAMFDPVRPGPVGPDIDFGPDGTVWFDPLTFVDGSSLRHFETCSSAWDADPSTGADSHVPDGAACIDEDTFRFADGTTLRQFEIPTSASHVDPGVRAYSFAPDGSIWIVVVDKGTPEELGCELEPLQCEGFSDGLYVITPEAVAATD